MSTATEEKGQKKDVAGEERWMSFSLGNGGDLTMLVWNERGQRMINSVGEWFAESGKSLNNISHWCWSAR